MLAAVEAWVKRDHQAEWKTWLSWLNTVSTRVAAIDGVKAAVREPTGLSNRSPALVISWDPARLNVTGEELAEELAKTKPRIALGAGGGGQSGLTSVSVTAWMMQPGDDKVVAERLHAALSRRRDPRPTAVAAPAANIAGHWDVDIEFYSGSGRHTLLVHQDGNWLEGSHQGDFTARDMAGTIEGTQVKIRSMERLPGSAVPFIFAGTLTGNTMAGDVYMGEYLNAKFTARRHTYSTPRAPIRVPSGRPLAT